MQYIRIRILEYRDRQDDDATKAGSHRKVGTFGFQEINNGVVLALKDEKGNPYPSSAAIGYEVIEADPDMPPWGIADKKK
jgi:hypothetical protein